MRLMDSQWKVIKEIHNSNHLRRGILTQIVYLIFVQKGLQTITREVPWSCALRVQNNHSVHTRPPLLECKAEKHTQVKTGKQTLLTHPHQIVTEIAQSVLIHS